MKNVIGPVFLAGVFSVCSLVCAEEPAPNQPPPPPAAQPPANVPPGANINVRGDGPNAGPVQIMRGGGGRFGGRGYQMPDMAAMMARSVGVDIDAKATAKLDTLSLGADRNFVLNVPVGGVDTLVSRGNPQSTSLKMEQVFKLTDEQTKSVSALRDEYAAEQKKLEQQMLDQSKAMAEKVRQLRTQYEQRANDVLTGADKEAKQKLDAMTKDLYTQTLTTLTEASDKAEKAAKETEKTEKTDNGVRPDFQKQFAVVRELRDQHEQAIAATQAKMLELMPSPGKELFDAIIKVQNTQREQMRQWNGGARARGENGHGPHDANPPKSNEAVSPPRPPANDF